MTGRDLVEGARLEPPLVVRPDGEDYARRIPAQASSHERQRLLLPVLSCLIPTSGCRRLLGQSRTRPPRTPQRSRRHRVARVPGILRMGLLVASDVRQNHQNGKYGQTNKSSADPQNFFSLSWPHPCPIVTRPPAHGGPKLYEEFGVDSTGYSVTRQRELLVAADD